jgi:hypothetical protein
MQKSYTHFRNAGNVVIRVALQLVVRCSKVWQLSGVKFVSTGRCPKFKGQFLMAQNKLWITHLMLPFGKPIGDSPAGFRGAFGLDHEPNSFMSGAIINLKVRKHNLSSP